MRQKYKYDKKLKKFSRQNRQKQTPGEIKLWKHLRNRNLLGYKFRRQFPFQNYILDFYCNDLSLCVEIDGSSHEGDKYDKDIKRDKVLNENGILTLRFTEFEVTHSLDNVLQTIIVYIESFERTSP